MPAPPPDPADSDASWPSEARRLHLWRGLRARWAFTSHRLPLLDTRITPDGAHRFAMRIGAFPSDRVSARAEVLELVAVELASGVSELGLTSRVGWPTEASLDHALPHPVPADAVVVLDGFTLDALENPAGWHFGALGLDVSLPSSERVLVRARVRPAESPHPFHFGLGDWSFDRPAVHRLQVRWRVLQLPEATPWRREALVPATTRSALSLDPVLSGDALLTGFHLGVDAPARHRRLSGYLRNLNGRYLRALGVGVERTPDGDRPFVLASNRPHGLVRLGALLGVYGGALLGAWMVSLGPTYAPLGAGLLGLLLGATIVWPGLWWEAPAVPFELRARVEGISFAPRGEARSVEELSPPG